MGRLLWAGLALFTLLPGWAQPPAPRPYSGGDYWVRNENTWLEWEVSAKELNGRLTDRWPANDEEPGALLNIDWRIEQWPVVAKFLKGDRLKVRPDSVGGSMWKDFDGYTWMRVQLPDNRFCFVRANARYLKPVKSEATALNVSEPVTQPVQTTLPEPEK